MNSILVVTITLSLATSNIVTSSYAPDELLVKYRAGFYPEGKDSYLKKIGWAKVKVKPGSEMKKTFKRLKKDPRIIRVEYNYCGELLSIPDDPGFEQQWYLDNIRVPEAWDISLGKGAIIALIDSGLDLSHPDLAANILIEGYDFGDNDDDPTDLHGHGTQMGGVIVALQNNSTGISGIASQAKILPIKASKGSTATIAADALANAIVYATDNEARIINLSLYLPEEASVVTDAVAYAAEAGAILLAAAGNGSGPVLFPARLEEVIAVSATNEADGFWFKSNYGPEIDLCAPGVHIYTTERGGGYTTDSGTSFSCAITSAVTALLIARYPGLTSDQVKERLFTGVDDLGDLGKDNLFGYGKINAVKVLEPGDADGDSILDDEDNCPYDTNPFQEDSDEDGVGDRCDNCPYTPNGPEKGTCVEYLPGLLCRNDADCGASGFCSTNQEDIDSNGVGDVCESPCIITTIYGEDSPEVMILRTIRDNILSTSTEGQEIIRLYYRLSPLLTKMAKRNELFRKEIQELFDLALLLKETH